MPESIEQVMNYILQHYCEDITLNDVASAVYLNPIYISRLIKEQTGKGFSEWLMEMRIKKAVSQLKHTDRYVYQIAEDVGCEFEVLLQGIQADDRKITQRLSFPEG